MRKGGKVNAGESALFGSLSGCVAAAATTPLDVLKTRLMLGKKVRHPRPLLFLCFLTAIYRGS